MSSMEEGGWNTPGCSARVAWMALAAAALEFVGVMIGEEEGLREVITACALEDRAGSSG